MPPTDTPQAAAATAHPALASAKSTACAWVARHQAQLSAWTRTIWDYAEPAFREYRSAAWYVERLRAEGFQVEAGSAGMPTAFCARWTSPAGPGATVAGYAEYDAVPGNCQAAEPREGPRPGLSPYAAGHTDPHSALGTGALGGILAAKAAMEAHHLPGTLVLFGEPAEKLRASKPLHAAAGYYDGLDGAISFHPFYMLPLCNTVRWDTHCGAGYAAIYRFIAEPSATWMTRGPGRIEGLPIPHAHASARAPGADDALFTMYGRAHHMARTMLPQMRGWSLSEAILVAGQATADNLPARVADIQYLVRTPTVAEAERVFAVLDHVAAGAAALAHCRWERHWVAKSRPGLPNHALARATFANLRTAGPPVWGAEALEVANQMRRACGADPVAQPLLAEISQLIAPEQAEAMLRQGLPPDQANFTSDDYTDYCWHTPTVRLYVGRAVLAPRDDGGPAWPDWVMNALGGIPATIDPTVTCAARVVAMTALDLIADEGLRAAARDEWRQRTAGDAMIAPLADYPPAIDFRWPEYITTARGTQWWIPA